MEDFIFLKKIVFFSVTQDALRAKMSYANAGEMCARSWATKFRGPWLLLGQGRLCVQVLIGVLWIKRVWLYPEKNKRTINIQNNKMEIMCLDHIFSIKQKVFA